MKVGVIGYRRHAEKHVKLAKNLCGEENVIIFHPHKKKSYITNDFDNILRCDCIVVSSPTNTHLYYIEKLAENKYKGNIYLEKPGFSSLKESYELEELQSKNNLRITIGYHYPFEEKIKRILKIIEKEEIGEIISIEITMSKGIAYSKWFKNDWRNNDKRAISHTVLSHAISIFFFLTNSSKNSNIETKVFYNNQTESFDTAIASSLERKPLFKAITSWGAPFVDDRINILTTNSIISLNGDLLTINSPRDTFDSDGLYTCPRTILSERLSTEGIKPALNHFYQESNNLKSFDYELFKKSLTIGRLCMSSEIVY